MKVVPALKNPKPGTRLAYTVDFEIPHIKACYGMQAQGLLMVRGGAALLRGTACFACVLSCRATLLCVCARVCARGLQRLSTTPQSTRKQGNHPLLQAELGTLTALLHKPDRWLPLPASPHPTAKAATTYPSHTRHNFIH